MGTMHGSELTTGGDMSYNHQVMESKWMDAIHVESMTGTEAFGSCNRDATCLDSLVSTKACSLGIDLDNQRSRENQVDSLLCDQESKILGSKIYDIALNQVVPLRNT
jgi:hypothetical protein